MCNLRLKRLFIFLFVPLLLDGCGLFDFEQDPEWENLKLPVQTGYKLFLSDGGLYVATGHDGLYFLESANPKKEWQYLGHKVTEGERHFQSGVQAINVYDNVITIGYMDPPALDDGARIGIWRSVDNGTNWVPSDDGIRTEEINYSSSLFLSRSPHDPSYMITSSAGETYYSEDGGVSWNPESSENFEFGNSILRQGFAWHPLDSNVVWTYGESGFFQPFLGKSANAGKSWERYSYVQVPRGNAFFDMAFDAVNPNLVYVGAQGAVIKSKRSGEEWKTRDSVTVAFTDPNGNFFYALEAHPHREGTLYAGATSKLYIFNQRKGKISMLKTPSPLTNIYDLVYDPQTNRLYAAGDNGVIRLKNLP